MVGVCDKKGAETEKRVAAQGYEPDFAASRYTLRRRLSCSRREVRVDVHIDLNYSHISHSSLEFGVASRQSIWPGGLHLGGRK